MFFRLCNKFENALERSSPAKLTAIGLTAAFGAIAVGMTFEEARSIIANTGGVLGGACVIIRQAGFKKSDNMKKINLGKSSGGLVQYVLGGYFPAVAIHINSLILNNVFLSKRCQTVKRKLIASAAGAAAVTAISAPFIIHAATDESQPPLTRVFNASVQSLPMVANYFGILGIAQREGKWHRLSMGAAGGISVVFDVASESYGMLVSSVGSFVSTGIGWWKHDRKKPEEPAPSQ